jgi:SAM-dependent methyltransferase
MTQTAAEFWDRQAQATAPTYWAEYPLVRRYVNECVTDCWWAYPTHGFKAAWAYKPLARGLSIGCGTGLLEKDLRWMRICEEVDAYDISPESIRLARERAVKEGVDRVHYEVADCERFDYPAAHYDAVFFNGSMHHISDPAALLDKLLIALKPGGFVFLDDYVGPSRDEWSDAHLVHAHEAYAALPPWWRTVERLAPPYDASDPSEMVASSAILPAVHERFKIEWEKPYWGNLLYPVLSQVSPRAASLPDADRILTTLIEREKKLVAEGAFLSPLFAWVVGRKKST